MERLRNRVKELREGRQISQKQLAEDTGISRETIFRLEHDMQDNPSYRVAFLIASYFGEPVQNVFTYVEE